MAWLLLSLAIAAEVTGTLALKASDGFSKPWPSVLVVAGYVAAFALLGLVLRDIPVGVTYAIWAGVGTAGAAIGGLVLFGDRLPGIAIVGIVVVIVGIVMITLSQAGH